MKENYDVYQVRMLTGRKDIIKAHAEARSESVNGFVNRAISETMERDNNAIAANEGHQKKKGGRYAYSAVRFTIALYGAGRSGEEKQVIERKGGIAA